MTTSEKIRAAVATGQFYDEQARQDAFVASVGHDRAEQLQQINRNTYASGWNQATDAAYSREHCFRLAAKREGFKNSEINALLAL